MMSMTVDIYRPPAETAGGLSDGARLRCRTVHEPVPSTQSSPVTVFS